MKNYLTTNKISRTIALIAIFIAGGCQTIALSEKAQPEKTQSEKPEASAKTAAPISSAQMADNIMAWWDGDYDNDAQIAALREEGAPVWRKGQADEGEPIGGHLSVTSHYRTVDMPAFGDRVIYVEEYTFTDNPYRQRIYTVIHDAQADQTRVKLWYFKDRESYLGAFEDLTKIAALTPDDMSALPDHCDLYVKETDDGRLHMEMPKNQCKFGESIFDYQVILSPDEFWYRDQIIDAASMDVKMTAGNFTYHKLARSN